MKHIAVLIVLSLLLGEFSFAQRMETLTNMQQELFNALTNVNDKKGVVLQYEVNRENFPNPPALKNMEEQKSQTLAGISNSEQRARIQATMDKMISQLKFGNKITVQYNIYISNTADLVCEVIYPEGNIVRRFIKNNNAFEQQPNARQVKILGNQRDIFSVDSLLFPALGKIVNSKSVNTRMVLDQNDLYLEEIDPSFPLIQRFYLNAAKEINESKQITQQNQTLGDAVFLYDAQSKPFPLNIDYRQFAPDGLLLCHQIWKLKDIKKLPSDFGFDPLVDKTYHVNDATGSNISDKELNRLLGQ